MRRPSAVFTIALALGAIILAPRSAARADGRQEGPREIEKCQTIDKPGSYKLVQDLTFTGPAFSGCLTITTDSVTIDLAGFTINGPGAGSPSSPSAAILASPSSGNLQGIAVRNGSISNFTEGVALSAADGSIVEGLRVFGGRCPCSTGIVATGVVKGNTVLNIAGFPGEGIGISATGIITGNYAIGSRIAEYQIGQGSTVIGNTAVGSPAPSVAGFDVSCPSNVTDNTATNNGRGNLVLNGSGCNDTNNVAP
jgi:hypothetical protein